ncbi:MAG: T9SS type A sorting domain-containing protein [Bradyrhizobiaceae bacterium]|nr:T9SS type A sorting domain-containing protein [Bradyrhizobiaceae bacterium]
MKGFVHHIARNLIVGAAMLAALVVGASEARADKAKVVSKTKSAVSTSRRLTTPGLNAVDAVVTALGQKSSTPAKAKVSVANDTVRTDSRIVSVHAAADVFTAKIDLASEQPQVDLAIYNMLGKKMSEVYRGPASKGEHEYVSSISDLPEGVYICILQGSNFRRAEKFYLSR